MHRPFPAKASGVMLALLFLTGGVGMRSEASDGTEALYWCPGQLGQERLETRVGPSCVPFIEEREGEGRIDLRTPLTLKTSASVVAAFLAQYRRFLSCCATDPAWLDTLADLESQASEIIKQQLDLLPALSLRTGQGPGLILPVLRARQKLRELKIRLEQIKEIQAKLDPSESESAARARRRRAEIIESIELDFALPREIVRLPTGPEIGTPGPQGRVGSEIGAQPPAGPAIGVVPPTGREIGTTPPTGAEIGTTPPTGPAIGTTPPTGPEIGESTTKPHP